MSAFTGMQLTKEEEPVLQAIEADIDRYSKLLVELRRRRNSFVRLNRLPPELLAEIFLHCRGGTGTYRTIRKRPSVGLPLLVSDGFLSLPFAATGASSLCRHLNSGRTLTFSTLNS